MARFSNPLSHVRVASPCPADWDTMIGDERVRFCGQCELKVYNLSAMTRTQAEDLIAGTEGRLCVRFYRRKDGSVLTRDCPVGLVRIKQRLSGIRRAITVALLGFFTGASGSYAVSGFKTVIGEPHVVGMIAREVDPPHEIGDALVGTQTNEAPTITRVSSRKRVRR